MNDSPDIAIDVEGLTKSFDGRVVVRDLSMKVKRGTIYGFLGPNGSGKTTTIRMLCGLLTPDSGRGTTLGYDILTQADEIKRQVGYMTQKFSLYQDLTVRENLVMAARAGLEGHIHDREIVRAVVLQLGIAVAAQIDLAAVAVVGGPELDDAVVRPPDRRVRDAVVRVHRVGGIRRERPAVGGQIHIAGEVSVVRRLRSVVREIPNIVGVRRCRQNQREED